MRLGVMTFIESQLSAEPNGILDIKQRSQADCFYFLDCFVLRSR